MNRSATPRPAVVVFDLGKVLLDFDYSTAVKRLLKRSSIQPAEFLALLQSPLLYRYEAGEITTSEFFAEVKKTSGFQGDLSEFSQVFADIFTPITPMIEAHACLRKKGVPTYILSNTNELAVSHIRKNFPFFLDFTGYVLSYERRALKPGPAIYRMVEAISGCTGSKVLYIDDRPENVATGIEFGWQTIVHESPQKTLPILGEVGLL